MEETAFIADFAYHQQVRYGSKMALHKINIISTPKTGYYKALSPLLNRKMLYYFTCITI